MPLCLSTCLKGLNLEVKSKGLSAAHRVLCFSVKICYKSANCSSRLWLWMHFHWQMGPGPPHSLQLHDAHSEYALLKGYLLQPDGLHHFSDAPLTFLPLLKLKSSPYESLWHNWWDVFISFWHGRGKLKMPVHLCLGTDHLHLPACSKEG